MSKIKIHLARQTLDEYYRGFQEGNSNLKVFSAHLHMDEATPHTLIDFVPFTTGSKRGLDTRVSLKQVLAAQGLKKLWEIDVKACPYQTSRLNERLKIAEYTVHNNLVDLSSAEPETFGKNGFSNPKELLNWLKNNRPEEDIVLTHGDYCLPNIFVKENEISGFIDIGKTGPADRLQDIAIAIRSLKHNFDGKYTGGDKIFDFNPQMLLDELNINFDEQKYKYYILLDELF